MFASAVRKLSLTSVILGGAALSGLLAGVVTPAEARVSVGIGFGLPLYPSYGYGPYYGGPSYYAPSYYAPYYPRPYYTPPVVYAPAPAYYGEAPPLVADPSSPVYRAPNGEYCREYRSNVNVAGGREAAYGTACQDPDGTWRVR